MASSIRNESSPSSSTDAGERLQVAGQSHRLRAACWHALRILVTLGAFVLLFSLVDVRLVLGAVRNADLPTLAISTCLVFLGVGLGALRWKALLSAYGSKSSPPVGRLLHLYLVGQFYNTFLPGAVGGDVVRGVATREAFGENGVAGSITVVLIERAVGLAALLLVVSVTTAVVPMPAVRGVMGWSIVGIGIAALAVTTAAQGHRLGKLLPGKLGSLLASMPRLARPSRFAAALAMSLGTCALPTIAGHAIMNTLCPSIGLADSLVIVPLALAASFFPITVAGAGAREAAFVALWQTKGISAADALAGSLLMLACQLAVACAGGIAAFLKPIGRRKP
ncbi:MAG: lysylphosphatidylglycerol synthase transmembrane domain-containing protein [Pseudomonadota bacterium]